MSHVLVLTASAAHPVLGTDLAEAVREAAGGGKTRWLCEGVACEFELPDGNDADQRLLRARAAIDDAPVDCNAVSKVGRRKRLLVADMDSTMIEQECIDEIGDLLGIKDQIARITEFAMRGEWSFEVALRKRVALLKGVAQSDLIDLAENRVSLMAGAGALISTMRAAGAYTALVSGGFTLFTSRIAEKVGFDEFHANTLLFNDDHLSGEVAEPIVGPAAKRSTLIRLREERGLWIEETMAVGDGANDIMMLRSAGLGVAYRAKPKVAAAAQARIDHGDLTALLYLQGYAREEFAGSPAVNS